MNLFILMLSIVMIRHYLTLRKVRTFLNVWTIEKIISEKELKYFSYSFKNASCLGKMYLLPNVHKWLYNVPGRPVIST